MSKHTLQNPIRESWSFTLSSSTSQHLVALLKRLVPALLRTRQPYLVSDVELAALLLEDWRRSANPFPFQADIYFDPVGDLDKGNVAVHAEVFAIEGHCAVDAPGG
jgi:hypothetical protein